MTHTFTAADYNNAADTVEAGAWQQCDEPRLVAMLRQAAAGPPRCGEGPCKWFDTGENHNGEIRGWCSKHDDDKPICVPFDGSGFCHLHEAKK